MYGQRVVGHDLDAVGEQGSVGHRRVHGLGRLEDGLDVRPPGDDAEAHRHADREGIGLLLVLALRKVSAPMTLSSTGMASRTQT